MLVLGLQDAEYAFWYYMGLKLTDLAEIWLNGWLSQNPISQEPLDSE